MSRQRLLLSLILLCVYAAACTGPKQSTVIATPKTQTAAFKNDTLIIDCDSVYKNQGYTVMHIATDTLGDSNNNSNSVFIIKKGTTEIVRDTIYTRGQNIEFADFNNDGIKDILVHNISDVRSNWTYFLYLADTKNNRFKKVKGFEEIKNPEYNRRYNIIESYVISGREYVTFYKIKGDTIHDFGVTIYNGEDENGIDNYDAEYAKFFKTLKPE